MGMRRSPPPVVPAEDQFVVLDESGGPLSRLKGGRKTAGLRAGAAAIDDDLGNVHVRPVSFAAAATKDEPPPPMLLLPRLPPAALDDQPPFFPLQPLLFPRPAHFPPPEEPARLRLNCPPLPPLPRRYVRARGRAEELELV